MQDDNIELQMSSNSLSFLCMFTACSRLQFHFSTDVAGVSSSLGIQNFYYSSSIEKRGFSTNASAGRYAYKVSIISMHNTIGILYDLETHPI